MKSRNSFAEAGLAAFAVTAMPRGMIASPSLTYVQSRMFWYCELLAIVKRAVGDVRYAATAPPCATSWSCYPTPLVGVSRFPIVCRFAQPFSCT